MIRPLAVYTAYTFDNRVQLTVRYETIFEARRGTRGALSHFKAWGLRCRVWYHYADPASGGYEVGIVFAKGIDDDAVHRAMFNQPPAYNMGVT